MTTSGTKVQATKAKKRKTTNSKATLTNPKAPKKTRRKKSEMQHIRSRLLELAEEHQPLTIRQLFYRAVAAAIIDKTQEDYNNVVVRLAGIMRESGELPFEWIVDNTRWMRKPRTYGSLQGMLHYTQQTYRRAIWNDQDAYVEIWCESDSIAGVLYSVTEEYDVPLMPCSGQPSKSFLYSAAQNIAAQDKPTYLYYFGDYDRSGMDISERLKRDFGRYLPRQCYWHFDRVAINDHHIADYRLPTRPPKDKRGGFTETVELEAMTTADLQALCRTSIEMHINPTLLEQTRQIEAAERDTLKQISANLAG